jgi:uncharacterized protein YecE (DUF72 family)
MSLPFPESLRVETSSWSSLDWRGSFYPFNNHYAGYAPGSVELFSRLWNEPA